MGSESVALLYHVNLPLGCLWVLTLFLPLSITYAILRYNLFDLSAMVCTLTYGVLTAIVIGAYLLLIWILNTLVQGIPFSQTEQASRSSLGWACCLCSTRCVHGCRTCWIAPFPHPLRFSSDHPDALSQDLTALLDLDEIAQRLVTTVTRALNVASAALYLDDGSGVYRPLAVVGEAADRLARLEPRRGNAIVELIARQRRGISQYDLEPDPALAQQLPGRSRSSRVWA